MVADVNYSDDSMYRLSGMTQTTTPTTTIVSNVSYSAANQLLTMNYPGYDRLPAPSIEYDGRLNRTGPISPVVHVGKKRGDSASAGGTSKAVTVFAEIIDVERSI